MLKRRFFTQLTLVLLFLVTLVFPAYAAVYTYDDLNRLTSVTYDNGIRIDYAYDAGGNLLSVVSTDTAAPVVNNSEPVDGAIDVPINNSISINFNESIVEDLNFNSITLKTDETVVSATYGITDNILTITPTTALDYNTRYTVYIPAGAVKDMFGNSFISDYSFSFTTIENV